MEVLNLIKTLYTPFQPTARRSVEEVSYQEFKPHDKLQTFIYCYWQLKTTARLQEPFTYSVVADGCMDIFFELNNPAENFVMGFCKKYTEFNLGNSFHYIGVRFLPTMFPQIFKVAAAELNNRFEHLELVVPETSRFIENNFPENIRHCDLTSLLDHHFLDLLSKTTISADNRLYNAIRMILQESGSTDIETGLQTGISPRQLRRLFKFYVGDTAKTFSRVVRFQHMLYAQASTKSPEQKNMFYDAGFYDQAHFIKDFKNFYGVTPSKAFQ
ncbi:MAG: helix-turn-helix domain-containing protein [Chloroflexota bacterium]|nr:helix-turn-helix domain-containing protein [Chloroflexota bacterium]